jgi:eukaryotic-like serine/threonine-protein kinase
MQFQGMKGTYQAIEELGRTNSSKLYLCEDKDQNLLFAKIHKRGRASHVYNEMLRFSQLPPHPNLVPPIDVGVNRRAEMFFPLLTAIDLGAMHSGGYFMNVGIVPEVLSGIGSALTTMHDQGIVHCDVKPENMMIGLDANDQVTKQLIDLGLATPIGKISLYYATPYCSAPETLMEARKPVSPATDVYALAATAYEMITKLPAFSGESAMDSIIKNCKGPRPIVPDKKDLTDLLQKAMAIKQKDRVQTVDEFLTYLAQVM